MIAGHDGHRGWVYYLAAHPDHREARIGRDLMNAAKSWLRENGIPKLQVMVRADNAAVVEFYERLGYVDQQVTVLGRFLNEELRRHVPVTYRLRRLTSAESITHMGQLPQTWHHRWAAPQS